MLQHAYARTPSSLCFEMSSPGQGSAASFLSGAGESPAWNDCPFLLFIFIIIKDQRRIIRNQPHTLSMLLFYFPSNMRTSEGLELTHSEWTEIYQKLKYTSPYPGDKAPISSSIRISIPTPSKSTACLTKITATTKT